MSPAVNVRLPHGSSPARCTRLGGVSSRKERSDHSVPSTPNGTLTQNTARHEWSATMPPMTRPRNDPAIAAIWLMPIAAPRRSAG